MTYAPGVPAQINANDAAVEVIERGDRLTITIRDGSDVAVVSGTPAALLGLAQNLKSVVEVAS